MIGDRFRAGGAVRPGYWFRPKRFGFGATPVTWQGWAATLAFGAAAGLIVNFAVHRERLWLVLLVPLIAVFLWLVAVKTDGDWRFRWGNDD
ncbi:hypothetical protein OMP43_11340 [Sphingomonas sp. CBMAI 2297]|uniref:hypothetical protein n=1 Tax=Sphingomonas sp. CBMAI 2297 TaxID=2991720 RepID=UPI002456944D|nr:hypothetical protein [Sphingomonas sp. CBMAI 2297]MDH4744611.1 hypothetical protein [Sphingomonas sp. CBMAI 2297]